MNGGGHNSGGSMRWLLTYADMITLLLAFFVILYAVSKMDAKRYKVFTASVRAAFGSPVVVGDGGGTRLLPQPDLVGALVERLRERMDEEVRQGRVQIERGPDGIVLRFQDSVFFDRGKAELNPEARRILDKLAVIFAELPNPIEAEGHTDTLPIRSAQFPSNWELSVARATAVVRYLVERHGISPTRFAARGLAEHRPLVPNHPTLGAPQNRRVELKIITRG